RGGHADDDRRQHRLLGRRELDPGGRPRRSLRARARASVRSVLDAPRRLRAGLRDGVAAAIRLDAQLHSARGIGAERYAGRSPLPCVKPGQWNSAPLKTSALFTGRIGAGSRAGAAISRLKGQSTMSSVIAKRAALLSRLPVRWQISSGFAIVLILMMAVAWIGYSSLGTAIDGFTDYARVGDNS